jgi:hypothetical protein
MQIKHTARAPVVLDRNTRYFEAVKRITESLLSRLYDVTSQDCSDGGQGNGTQGITLESIEPMLAPTPLFIYLLCCT